MASKREIIDLATERVTNPRTPAPHSVKWSGMVIAASQACNAVLRDIEIDQLKQQINKLRQLTLSRLSEDKDVNANDEE